ncbi:MAG: hypothetical protein HQM06_17265 [Magnetococcales bacterium]|nr:hypothetical protein [Magnetococcales bacterium]
MLNPLEHVEKIFASGGISKSRRLIDLYVIEDLHGIPMGFTQSESLSRIYYIAPGMLGMMERLAKFCLGIIQNESDPALRLEAEEIYEEIREMIHVAMTIPVASKES